MTVSKPFRFRKRLPQSQTVFVEGYSKKINCIKIYDAVVLGHIHEHFIWEKSEIYGDGK